MAMKKQILVVGLALVLGSAGLVLAQSEAAKKIAQHSSISYQMEITVEGQKPVGFDYQTQGSQSLMKMESEPQGRKNHVEMLLTGDAVYILNREQKTAIKFGGKDNPMAAAMFPLAWAVQQPEWTAYAAAHHEGYTITDKGTETVRGQKCKVKEFNNLQTKDKVLLYVSDDGVIRRWVVLNPGAGQKKSTMDLIALDFDKKIPDSVFAVPAGYKVQDMSNMPMMHGREAPKAPKQP
jgi:outer membrane lipoprotein-sorting protein